MVGPLENCGARGNIKQMMRASVLVCIETIDWWDYVVEVDDGRDNTEQSHAHQSNQTLLPHTSESCFPPGFDNTRGRHSSNTRQTFPCTAQCIPRTERYDSLVLLNRPLVVKLQTITCTGNATTRDPSYVAKHSLVRHDTFPYSIMLSSHSTIQSLVVITDPS